MGNSIATETSAPVIWVEVQTSSPTLSKSDNPAFTIALQAHNDSRELVTINPFRTILDPKITLGQYGLAFRDTESGELADPRINMDVTYYIPERVVSSLCEEIPPKDSPERFAISCKFQTAAANPPSRDSTLQELKHIAEDEARSAAMSAEIDRPMPLWFSQVEDCKIGHTYGIELRNGNQAMCWGKKGAKRRVFAFGSLPREGLHVPLKLVNTATFNDVE